MPSYYEALTPQARREFHQGLNFVSNSIALGFVASDLYGKAKWAYQTAESAYNFFSDISGGSSNTDDMRARDIMHFQGSLGPKSRGTKRRSVPPSEPSVHKKHKPTQEQKLLPAPAAASSTNMSTPAEDDEAQVVPPPNRISKIIPDYTTIQLPLHHAQRFGITFVDPLGIGVIAKNSINLNTINLPIANTTKQYRGKDTWAGLFDFYRVLRTDIRLTWHSANATHMVGWHLHEDSSDSNWTSRRDMAEAKHGGYDFIQNMEADSAVNPAANRPGGLKTMCVQQYSFDPMEWDHHVTQNGGDAQRWTAIGATPGVQRFFHYGAVSPYPEQFTGAGAVKVDVNIDILITVQFREAKEAILMNELPVPS